jgi:citrate lyase alpha subunit
MSDKMDKVLKTLTKISEDIVDIKVSQAGMSKDIERNTDDLEEHMRRTDLLERRLEPLQAQAQSWSGVGKGITYGSILISAVWGIIKIIGIFGE